MTENEKEEFKTDIVNQVQKIVSDQAEWNKANWEKFNSDLGDRFEKTLPSILAQIAPKNNYWFPLMTSILNGVVVGVSIYAAMCLFSA